ncbi:hypothetical protein CMO91_01795 [Candidatus Woesearchaeota archaeon]|nr:hypothetical protein [Candidatus Woesearchaeota archaeon]|tara:strand:- start:49 stop:372 length:324 start_codon:yes stop_codon:yes gene_type:complete
MGFLDLLKTRGMKNKELEMNLNNWSAKVSKWTMALDGLGATQTGDGSRALQEFTGLANKTVREIRSKPRVNVSEAKAKMVAALSVVLDVMQDDESKAEIEAARALLQ